MPNYYSDTLSVINSPSSGLAGKMCLRDSERHRSARPSMPALSGRDATHPAFTAPTEVATIRSGRIPASASALSIPT